LFLVKLILRAAVVLAVSAALYIVVDLAAAAIIGPLHRPAPDFAAIPGFRDQPYVTPGFAGEYTEMQSFDSVPGTALLWPALRRGMYFNVERLPPTESHYRRTMNPPHPRKPVRLVLVIGGSLIFGPAVPDSYTIPSLLSRRLNEEDKTQGYELLNAGVDGAVSGQELARLQYELEHGLKPDLVLVIDGPVDMAQGVYEGKPGGFAISGRSLVGELIHRYVPLHIYDWLRFRLGGLATERHWRSAPAHLTDPTRLDRLTRESIELYVANVTAMADLARKAGARFMVAINPTLGSSDYAHPTGDIAYASDLQSRLYPGEGQLKSRIRAAFAAAIARLRQRDIIVLDLTALFADKTVDVFVEPSHFNAVGHAMIADALARAILYLPGP
jgi:hypothetical protein